MSSTLIRIKAWVKNRDNPTARFIFKAFYAIRYFNMPYLKWLHVPLWHVHQLLSMVINNFLRIFYWTPLFKTRLQAPLPKRLYLYGGKPAVMGPLHFQVGENTRMSSQSIFIGRSSEQRLAHCHIGSNVDIGYATVVAVGTRVVLEDDVRLSGDNRLSGFPGHPLEPRARAIGEPDGEDQIGDIILESGCWLASGVTVNAGVTIGAGSVIASGSVVTKDIPPNVLAGGIPAKVIRELPQAKEL